MLMKHVVAAAKLLLTAVIMIVALSCLCYGIVTGNKDVHLAGLEIAIAIVGLYIHRYGGGLIRRRPVTSSVS